MGKIITLIDMDAFFCQVECRDRPELYGKPVGVSQYSHFGGSGRLIALSYEAKDVGVKRGMLPNEARQVCPEIIFVEVPHKGAKADNTKYSMASKEIFHVLENYDVDIILEKASVDEAYVDITALVDRQCTDVPLITDLNSTFVISSQAKQNKEERVTNLSSWLNEIKCKNVKDSLRWAVAAQIVEDIRTRILNETKFHSSAGIAYNRMLAKICCGLHKPKHQTVLTPGGLEALWRDTLITKVPYLGGKLGISICETLNIENMQMLSQKSKTELCQLFGEKTGCWLSEICMGIGSDKVSDEETIRKSIAASKKFGRGNLLSTVKIVFEWLEYLANELLERLQNDKLANTRVAKTLTVGISLYYKQNDTFNNMTKACEFKMYDSKWITNAAFDSIKELNTSDDINFWKPCINLLSLSASRFEDISAIEDTKNITEFFKPVQSSLIGNEQIGLGESDAESSRDSIIFERPGKIKCFKSISSNLTCSSSSTIQVAVDESEAGPSNGNVSIVPIGSSSPIDCADVMPTERGNIKSEDWNSLPPDIQLELSMYYRTNKMESNVLKMKPKKPQLSTKRKKMENDTATKPVSLLKFFKPN